MEMNRKIRTIPVNADGELLGWKTCGSGFGGESFVPLARSLRLRTQGM